VNEWAYHSSVAIFQLYPTVQRDLLGLDQMRTGFVGIKSLFKVPCYRKAWIPYLDTVYWLQDNPSCFIP